MATQIARVEGTVTVETPEELPKKTNLSVGDAVEWLRSWGSAHEVQAERAV